ncbi:hypothetical protein AGOR_G00124470 [Albula goreensis]|uniref:Transmembrane protein 126A n=1 Tax=Albula goreensis TaxID=1534307 RepID=A0A8T3D9Q9_9TELE|nr:hypothetical protein AGOR_G00124470 [Albula goreensis]
MSETVQMVKVEDLPPKSVSPELLLSKFEQLPEIDKKLFTYSPLYLGFNGAFAGLIANSFFRRLLNVTQGRVISSVPMAVVPFLSTMAVYHNAVSEPLLRGDLDCQACTQIRGGMIGAVVGGFYPIVLALPLNASLALRHNTITIQENENVLRFVVRVTKPVLKKMGFVLVLQGIFGGCLSYQHYGIYKKLLDQPDSGSEDSEIMVFNKTG